MLSRIIRQKQVSITVMDPKTGEVLAMVNKPDFDPNNPREGVDSFEEIPIQINFKKCGEID